MNLRQAAKDLEQLYHRPARMNFHAEHLAQYRDANLKSHSREKTHQHTVWERKSARKPSLSSRARSRNPAVSSATIPASATYLALASGAMPESPPARMAAVAESAETTRYREEPNTANASSGSNSV